MLSSVPLGSRSVDVSITARQFSDAWDASAKKAGVNFIKTNDGDQTELSRNDDEVFGQGDGDQVRIM